MASDAGTRCLHRRRDRECRNPAHRRRPVAGRPGERRHRVRLVVRAAVTGVAAVAVVRVGVVAEEECDEEIGAALVGVAVIIRMVGFVRGAGGGEAVVDAVRIQVTDTRRNPGHAVSVRGDRHPAALLGLVAGISRLPAACVNTAVLTARRVSVGSRAAGRRPDVAGPDATTWPMTRDRAASERFAVSYSTAFHDPGKNVPSAAAAAKSGWACRSRQCANLPDTDAGAGAAPRPTPPAPDRRPAPARNRPDRGRPPVPHPRRRRRPGGLHLGPRHHGLPRRGHDQLARAGIPRAAAAGAGTGSAASTARSGSPWYARHGVPDPPGTVP